MIGDLGPGAASGPAPTSHPGEPADGQDREPVDAGGDDSYGAVASLQVLTDAPPVAEVVERGIVPVPGLTALVIGVSVAFSIVFGIIPGPILDFAHHATLLFP